MDYERIALKKPLENRRVHQSNQSSFTALVNYQSNPASVQIRWPRSGQFFPPGFALLFGHRLRDYAKRAISEKPCQNVTPAKRPWSKSRRLPNPSRSTARTFSALTISSASYARPRNGWRRKNQPSHRASSLSRSAEKFASRFLALSAFFSVKVTRYAFLPSGGLPAPSLFPPCLSFFMLEK